MSKSRPAALDFGGSGLKRRAALVIALAPVLFWLGSAVVAKTNEPLFFRLTAEDGLVENAQVAAFFIGTLLAASIARIFCARKQLGWGGVYAFAAIAFFWVAGEEISWGQRLFGFETTGLMKQINIQSEMNLHNIQGVGRAAEGLLRLALGLVIVLSGPLWSLDPELRKRLAVRWWVPHPVLIPAWLCVLSYPLLRGWYHWRNPDEAGVSMLVSRLQEPRELILAVAFLVFLWMVRRELLGKAEKQGKCT